jgi:hypothetical protein
MLKNYSKLYSFSEFVNESEKTLNEGAIPVYGEEGPFKQIRSMRVVDVVRDFRKMLDSGMTFTVIADLDGGDYLGKQSEEAEFDVIGVEQAEKPSKPGVKEDVIRIRSKKGDELLVRPGKIIEIQIGNSMKDNIAIGSSYLIGDKRGALRNYQNGIVTVRLQNGQTLEIPIDEWKKANYLELED